MGTSKRVHPF